VEDVTRRMEQDADETNLLEEHTKVEEWLTEKNVDRQQEIQHSVVFYKHGANNMGKFKLVHIFAHLRIPIRHLSSLSLVNI